MTWTLCTSGSAIAKAGANANSTIIASGSTLLEWCNEAEGRVCAECHTDFVTNYTSFETQIKRALADITSSIIAQNIVSYDMGGYSDRREAETILDVLDNQINKGLLVLQNKEKQKTSG